MGLDREQKIELTLYFLFAIVAGLVLAVSITGTIMVKNSRSQVNCTYLSLTAIYEQNNETRIVAYVNTENETYYAFGTCNDTECSNFVLGEFYNCWNTGVISKDDVPIPAGFALFIVIAVFSAVKLISLLWKMYGIYTKYRDEYLPID